MQKKSSTVVQFTQNVVFTFISLKKVTKGIFNCESICTFQLSREIWLQWILETIHQIKKSMHLHAITGSVNETFSLYGNKTNTQWCWAILWPNTESTFWLKTNKQTNIVYEDAHLYLIHLKTLNLHSFFLQIKCYTQM